MPLTTPGVDRRALSDPLLDRDNLQTVNALLGKLHEETKWPIELFQPRGNGTGNTSVLHHSYILFVWNEEASSLNEKLEYQMKALVNQVLNLRYSTSWNPRGRFLVVAPDSSNEPPHVLAAHICYVLWRVATIVNVVVLVPNKFAYRPLHAMSTTNTAAADRLNLYTWFPFEMGICGELEDAILLDEWVFENNDRFSENADLYPVKVPNNFMGCPITVGALGIDPYVIVTENYTQNNGSTAYKLTGLSIEILKFVCDKINLTTVFLPPVLTVRNDLLEKQFVNLYESSSDVVTGFIPLPRVVKSLYDVTIPYMHYSLKMHVPCPKAIPGTENVLTTFSLSVWLTIVLVLLLTTGVFWCAGNGPYRSVCNEAHTYRSLSNCFYNVWAVFVGVSVPQQPTTSGLRVFFFLYVCFCFAISTVFQAFFYSYLVEPKYEKMLETLDDLLDSDVVYGYNTFMNYAEDTGSYVELVKLFEHMELKEDCSDSWKCVERMITKRDIASLISPVFTNYVARKMGTADIDKIICSLDQVKISASLTVLFKKGNPLLDKFNILMRRYLEAGFQERFWTELQYRASLRGGERFRDSASDKFFAFSVSHLKPAFVVLLVGTVLSSVVFIVEVNVKCLCKHRKVIAELIMNCLCKRRRKYSRFRRVKVLYWKRRRVLYRYHRPYYRRR
jgi:hypothetical protein